MNVDSELLAPAFLKSKLFSRFVQNLPQICFTAGIAGILLRATIRDSIPGFATLFYGLPMPVCFAGFVVGTLAALILRNRKRLVLIGAGLSLLGAVLWISGSLVRNSTNDAEPDLRIAFWNAADNNRVFTRSLKLTEGLNPDIYIFAEIGHHSTKDADEFKNQLPGYQLVNAPVFVSVAARGNVQLLSWQKHKSGSMLYVFRVDLEGEEPLQIVVPDIHPNALYSRRHVLEEVLKLAGTGPRTLVIGDFNTPWESVWLNRYRERFHHAWQTAGNGLRETWPWPLPALSLDHLWSSKELLPVKAEKRYSVVSDHAMLVVDYVE